MQHSLRLTRVGGAFEVPAMPFVTYSKCFRFKKGQRRVSTDVSDLCKSLNMFVSVATDHE